jgi:hypothetical protein
MPTIKRLSVTTKIISHLHLKVSAYCSLKLLDKQQQNLGCSRQYLASNIIDVRK